LSTGPSRQKYGRYIKEWLANNKLVVTADELNEVPADLRSLAGFDSTFSGWFSSDR